MGRCRRLSSELTFCYVSYYLVHTAFNVLITCRQTAGICLAKFHIAED